MLSNEEISGVVSNEKSSIRMQPLINFRWYTELEPKDIIFDSRLNKDKVILSKKDLTNIDGKVDILCYGGEIINLNQLSDIYNKGFRVVRPGESLKTTKINASKLEKTKLIIDVHNLSDRNLKKLIKFSSKPIFLNIEKNDNLIKKKINSNEYKIKSVKELNGIVGINITKDYLTTNLGRLDSFEHIFRNIDNMVELIGVDNICFSTGFNKNKVLPWEVSKQGDIKFVENWLKVFYGDEVAEKIIWKNAYYFLLNNLS